MEQSNTPLVSTKGKGLGMAGMIIGIVALIWSIVPYVGAGALWLALPGFILSLVAFFMAKGGNNPNRGVMLTGIILNLVALILVGYWMYKIASGLGTGLNDLHNMLDTMKIDTITMH
ncbi:hypothetical protein BH11BAC7_BH11BAC7_12930 [soil metagenome]